MYIFLAYITNSKKGAHFREIFRSRKVFRRRESLKSTGLIVLCGEFFEGPNRVSPVPLKHTGSS